MTIIYKGHDTRVCAASLAFHGWNHSWRGPTHHLHVNNK